MPARIAVVTPHLAERENSPLYAESVASVMMQTRKPDQYIVEWDPEHTGTAATLNRALARVDCEWIAQLGDDDYFHPHHLEVMEANATADVIWPDCEMLNGPIPSLCQEFNEAKLRWDNYIPGGGTLIRTEAIRAVGGWATRSDADWHRFEDWVLWLRILNNGGTFRHIHEVTWVYRFHDGQTAGQL